MLKVPRALKRTEFVGREEDLRKLMHKLQRESSVLLLNGLGGIGKTTLAKEYVYRHQNEYRHIAWVNVLQDQTSTNNFSRSAYSALANHTGLFAQLDIHFDLEIPEEDRFRTIVAEMNRREGPNLLVLDNVGSAIITYYEDLPKAPGWKILATSRLELPPFSTYYLDELPMEEAEILFTNLYPEGKKYARDVHDLLNHIGRHTLTIELLARLCVEYPSIHPAGILKLLQDKQFTQISQSVWSHHSKREIEVYGYLMAAFSLTSLTEEERHQLIQWAVLPSIFVDWKTILQLFEVDSLEENSFENALRGLWKKGWITLEKKQESIDVINLFKKSSAIKFPPTVEKCRRIIQSITDKLFIDQSKDNPIDKYYWVPFGEVCLNHLRANHEKLNILKNNLAQVYRVMGDYKKAVDFFEQALLSDTQLLDELHPYITTRRSNLATTYIELGEYEKAKELLEKALNSELQRFDEQHPNVAKVKSNLGVAYFYLGKCKEAESLLKEVVELGCYHFGEQDPVVAKRKSNLSLVYNKLDKYEEAATLLKEAFESDCLNFGEQHPTTNTTRSNLAIAYRNLGKHEEAIPLLELALKLDLQHFGELHPNVAISRFNLAKVYVSMKNPHKARPLLENAFTTFRDKLGINHPNTLTVKKWIDRLEKPD